MRKIVLVFLFPSLHTRKRYMAPEFYSESYNQLVDIWAFGLVILEMLSNKVPYHECNGKDVCACETVTF